FNGKSDGFGVMEGVNQQKCAAHRLIERVDRVFDRNPGWARGGRDQSRDTECEKLCEHEITPGTGSIIRRRPGVIRLNQRTRVPLPVRGSMSRTPWRIIFRNRIRWMCDQYASSDGISRASAPARVTSGGGGTSAASRS